MSEIYKNTSQVVTLDVVGANTDEVPTATLVRANSTTPLTVETEPEIIPAPTEGGSEIERWTTRLSLAQTQVEETFYINWEFAIDSEEGEKQDWYEVVTPYVGVGKVRDELGGLINVTDADIIRAERKVRRVINRYCGQSFGLQHDTLIVKGSGTENINLPRRAHNITSIKSYYTDAPLEGYRVMSNGLVIKRQYSPVDDVSATVVTTNPIFNPYYDVKSDVYLFGQGLSFGSNTQWKIEGDWGYEPIPAEVEDAALILIEQYICPDATYRERYVKSLATADYRYETMAQAWAGTGNAVADYILRDYIWDSAWIV